MNILKKTRVQGEIFFDYAYLSYRMSFENKTDIPLSAEYMFALPRGAVVSEVKLVTSDGKAVPTSIVSVTHAVRLKEAEGSSAVIRRIDDLTYTFSIGSMTSGITELKLKVYVPIKEQNGHSLTIPLSCGTGGASDGSATASLSFFVHGVSEETQIFSPTHTIEQKNQDGVSEVSTGEIMADRDFCLRISGTKGGSRAVAVQNGTSGEMLCRVCLSRDFINEISPHYKRLLLVLDGTGPLLYGAFKAGKEVVYSMAEAFDGEVAIVVGTDTPQALTEGFCVLGDEDMSKLYDSLNRIQVGGGSVCDAMSVSKGYADPETLTVLVSGTELQASVGELCAGALCVVTVGSTERGQGIDKLLKSGKVSRGHIFGKDDVKERAKELLLGFCSADYSGLEINPNRGEAILIDTDAEGFFAYIGYTGGEIPREISVRCGEATERVQINEVLNFHSFAPIGLVCAELICSQLEERLENCRAEEIYEIREAMERVGIKYSALNSETALVAHIGTETAVIRVSIPSGGCSGYEVFSDRASIFCETDERGYSDEEVNACIDIIIKSLRADGAICASGEVVPSVRRMQTLVCLLSLVAADKEDAYREVLDRSWRYIQGFEMSGIRATRDKGEAAEYLNKLWGSENFIVQGVPDLLSASRILVSKKV